jgi:UDP-sugar transporter A1/2/3
MSGFASIYFEKVIKSQSENVTIWERNFQLGFYSLIIYGSCVIYKAQNAESAGYFANWSMLTVVVSALGAAGGLLVAATLKYADSILKTLAAAGAIVISTVLGHLLLDGPMDVVISIGAVVTIIAISNYTLDTTIAVKVLPADESTGDLTKLVLKV